MSYADSRQNRTVTIGAVIVVHAAIGYALMTGLATTVFHRIVVEPMQIYEVKDPAPPPPDIRSVPKLDKVAPQPSETVTAPIPDIATPSDNTLVIVPIESPPAPLPGVRLAPPSAPTPSPTVSLQRGVSPRGNQGDWFPQDSYPPAARRAEAEGSVSVRVTVGTNGRVSDCAVVKSSGNADLDGATCRLARRNGRFDPALDSQGSAVPSTFTLPSVRWVLQ